MINQRGLIVVLGVTLCWIIGWQAAVASRLPTNTEMLVALRSTEGHVFLVGGEFYRIDRIVGAHVSGRVVTISAEFSDVGSPGRH